MERIVRKLGVVLKTSEYKENAMLVKLLTKDGIAEQGTHDELMKTSEIYQDIYSSQVGEGGVDNG